MEYVDSGNAEAAIVAWPLVSDTRRHSAAVQAPRSDPADGGHRQDQQNRGSGTAISWVPAQPGGPKVCWKATATSSK